MLYFNLKRNYIFLILLIFCSCTNSYKSNEINKNNIEEKIEEAFIQSELYDKKEPLIPVLFFIDNNNIVFDNPTVLSKVYYLRAIRSWTIDKDGNFYKNAKKAVEIAEKSDNDILKSTTNNFFGIYFYFNNEYDSAIKYFKKSIFYGKKIKEKHFVIDSYLNISKAYSFRNNWEEVLRYTKEGLIICSDNKIKNSRLRTFYTLSADAYLKLGQYQKAENVLLKSINFLEESIVNNLPIDINKSYKEIYLTLAELNRQQKNFDLSYEYMRKADSLSFLQNQEAIEKVNSFVTKENDLKQELLKSNKNLILNHRIIITGIILILLVILQFFYKKNKYSNQLKELIKDKEELNLLLKNNLEVIEDTNKSLIDKNEEIEALLKFNKQSLITKTLKISNYKDAINNIIKKINKLAEENVTVSSRNLFKINKALEQVISEEEIWEDFKLQFEKSRPDFFDKLLKKSSNLSVNEQKHCAYVAVNLKSKEVANIINLSPRSVETTRYRIKKKLQLEDESLQDFLIKL